MDFSYLQNVMDCLTAWRMPGNSVCVYKGKELVFSYSSGYSDVENRVLMNDGELLNLYSCSKIATVTAALQLYERGLFLLDDPLSSFIPEYKEMYIGKGENLKKAESEITLRHLFTMTSGLTYNTRTKAFDKAREITNGKMDTLTVARCIAEDPLIFEPGTQWNYSLSHDVLAAVVEIVSGKKFRDYVKENIFDPLGMANAFYHNDGVRHKMAQQYRFEDSGNTLITEVQQNSVTKDGGRIVNVGKENSLVFGSEYDSGGAGITASVGDYALLTQALALGGRGINGERILSDGTVELLKTNQLNESLIKNYNWKQLRGYGYGLGVRTMLNRAESGSTGSIGEFGWCGAAGATAVIDTAEGVSMFYAHHMLNPQEEYYMPRIRNALYTSLKR